MKIYVAADHAGFHLKEKVLKYLRDNKYDVEDVGDKELNPEDDYPQYAYAAVTYLLGDDSKDPRAILICGSGQGMCIAANRVHGIRAALVWNENIAEETRQDNDSNVLCLPARELEQDLPKAYNIIEVWLKTPFSHAARHTRRIKEIEDIYG